MARSVWAANLLFAAVTIILLTPAQSAVSAGKLADKVLVGLHNLYHDDASLATSVG